MFPNQFVKLHHFDGDMSGYLPLQKILLHKIEHTKYNKTKRHHCQSSGANQYVRILRRNWQHANESYLKTLPSYLTTGRSVGMGCAYRQINILTEFDRFRKRDLLACDQYIIKTYTQNNYLSHILHSISVWKAL
jgi:hypothetical protein